MSISSARLAMGLLEMIIVSENVLTSVPAVISAETV